MAKGRVRSRMELREQYEAAEARERDARQEGEEDDGDEDEDVGDLDEEAAEDAGDEEDSGVKAKGKPKKKSAAKKAPAKPRKKTTKVVRKRVVWVVYDNSNKKIQQFDYIKKDEAVALAERLKTEKKQTYFVQPVKEEITE